MALVRWAFSGPVTTDAAPQHWFPATDVSETEDAFVLHADLPGVKQSDVTLEIEDNVLTVSGERRRMSEAQRGGYHRTERSFGRFSRAMTLPKGVDVDAVTASFTDGVLEVVIPKPEAVKPRRIEIGMRDQTAIEA